MSGQRSDRPGIQALNKFLKKSKTQQYVVIIDELNRFARRVPVHFELREAVDKASGILESPSMNFGDDADSEFNEYIQASVSQYQARKNAEQTLNRMKARVVGGYWPFACPIGLKHEKVKGHGSLLVRDEPIASLVQEALEGFASSRFGSQVEVKRWLENQPEFPKDLPGGKIRQQRIKEILVRPVYARYVEAPRWGIPIREGKHEGLISLETHQKIQARLKEGAYAPALKDISADFPLRGFVCCGDCGKPLTACWSKSGSGKKHPYYMCHNQNRDSRRKSIPRAKIEGDFEALLQNMQPTRGLFAIAEAMFKKLGQHA